MNWENILIPLGVCVVLPVLILWIIGRVRQNETNRKAEIMLKALEKGVSIDPELFRTARKSEPIKKDLLDKLTGASITGLMGIVFLLISLVFPDILKGWGMRAGYLPFAGAVLLAVGIGLFISYFTGKKMLAKEIEAEEKKLLEP